MNITWVCEVGSGHKGSLSLAYEYIRQAAIANPGGICKFQLGHYDSADPVQEMRYAPMRWAPELKEWCEYYGTEFMSSIFSMDGLRMARSIGQERYKFPSRRAFTAHSDEDYDKLLLKIFELKKEVFVSDDKFVSNHPLFRRLYCIPEYPTYPHQLANMPQWFGLGVWYYGYSSHVHGYADALVAVARGAKYIEKHVTISKDSGPIKDFSFSLSFDEFGEMVRIGNEIARLT